MRIVQRRVRTFELRKGFSITFDAGFDGVSTLTFLDVNADGAALFTFGINGVESMPLDDFLNLYGDHLEPQDDIATTVTQ